MHEPRPLLAHIGDIKERFLHSENKYLEGFFVEISAADNLKMDLLYNHFWFDSFGAEFSSFNFFSFFFLILIFQNPLNWIRKHVSERRGKLQPVDKASGLWTHSEAMSYEIYDQI